MIKHIPEPSPELNRLRAAVALISIIEIGLLDASISKDKAGLIASFCEWTIEKSTSDSPDIYKLTKTIQDGLKRIQGLLVAVT